MRRALLESVGNDVAEYVLSADVKDIVAKRLPVSS
jgi:hypothetical protein